MFFCQIEKYFQVDLIKAHLGSKMSDADLAGLRVSGLPALPSSSLYSHQQLMYGHGRDTPDMAASQPAINAMFNSYTFKVVKNILKVKNICFISHYSGGGCEQAREP